MIQEELFLSTLIQKGVVKKEDGPSILEEAKSLGKRVEDVVLEKGLGDEKKIAQVKSELFKLPVKFFDAPENISQKILGLIPEDTARQYKFIAFNKEGNILDIGMLYPDDLKAQQTVQFVIKRLGLGMRVFIITPSDLKNICSRFSKIDCGFSKEICP